MKAVLTRCLTLASLVALSTALSADSRLTSTGASGFLYSDYLQTAASGRSAELQGSFVVENHRPFFANIGAQLPRRIVGEIKTLPLREWGLDYVFENRKPAHQTALAERGWRIADWLAEETLMAATESGRGGGLIRTLEFDLQSELGGRRGSAGLNVLGALRETADYDALAWQLRGFKTKDGGGGSAGLIYRWLPDETALVGVNAFADYETRNGDGFWRWSAGAEVRTAWADLFGNYYQGITDDRRRGDEWIYTADGYDVELHVHSPDLPWLVGEIAYFNWKGRYGDSADRGFRFGVKFKPATGVEVALEYERRNSDRDEDDGDNKKEWSGWVRYAGKISKPIRRLRRGGEYNNYEPRDYFFSPAEREYTQRIRKAKGDAPFSSTPTFTFSAKNLNNSLPIELKGAGGRLDLRVADVGGKVMLMGTVSGATIPTTPLTPAADFYTFTVSAAITGTVTVSHMGSGKLTLTYPKTKTTAEIGSTLAIAIVPDDFLHLADGNADITVGTGGGGTMFVAQYVNPDDFILRFGIPIINVTQRISLATTLYFPEIFPENAIFTLLDKNGMTISSGILGNLRASIQLAADPFFRTGTTPPIYYKAKTATGPFVVATLRGTGGGGGYVWTKEGSGELEINGNVVSIPAGANVSESGVLLSVRAVLNDSDNLNLISRVTPPITADFTVSYREIADLAAKFNPAARNVYGLAGEGAEIVAATITAAGGADAFTYAKTGGQLNVRSAGGNGGFGHAVIPASILPSAAPGAELVLEAELSQPIPGGSSIRTIAFSLTVRYVGVNRISSPAFAAESGKAILAQSPTFYRVTALADNNAAMDIATLNEATGGGGGNKTYAKVGSGGLNFNTGTRKVSIPANTPPTGQRLGLTVRIADSGAGSEVTPEVTVMLTVQYVSVNRINLGFDDPDGLVTVFGLRNNNAEVGSVARAVADGGFGGVTVGKAGNAGLGLRGTEIYIPANNPPQAAPGRALLITVSANDNAADDPNDITDAALATMTLRYVQVQELSGGYLPVNTNGNGQAQSGARAINGIHTVGMAAAVQNQFTVASLSVSGGVGDYQYRQIGGGNLSVDSNGQILMAANVQPSAPGTGAPFVIVVEADDRGTNDDVTPAITLTLTVSYNTIVPIEARVMDTRDDAIPPEIPLTGGTVYFEHAGSDILTPFGTLVISGGFPSPVGDYSVTPSNPSGLTGISYDSGNKQLSMTKCDGSATKGIRLVIDDVGSSASTDLTEPLTVNFEVTSGEAQCVKAISVQLRNAADTADATSPVNVYGLAGETRATVAAVLRTSGGGGDLRMVSKSGDLDLVDNGGKNELRVRANTSPQDSPGRTLALTAVLDDDVNKGGFLTEPLTVEATVNYIAVPGVVLDLNRDGNPISDVVRIYGVENVARTEKIADIAASGGSGNVTATLRTSGADATTPNAFAISGNDLNLSRTFPAFGNPATATAAVVANDSGANAAVTPQVEKRATARLLPVRDKLQPGGNVDKAARNPNNVVSPTSPNATEGEFTVYVLEGQKEAGVIAQVGAASAADNAAVEGLSGLRVNAPTRHSSSPLTGLQFDSSGNNTNVRIENTATPTSSGENLNLVLEYNDIGHPVSLMTDPLLKTVRVHYRTVEPFAPEVRNAAGNAVLTDPATIYVAQSDSTEKMAAKLVKVGGAAGDMRVISRSGATGVLEVRDNGEVWVRANQTKGATEHVVVVGLNDAETPEGSVTPQVEVRVTVVYEETRDVQASFADITGNDHFLGAADSSSGVRTLYFKDGATRPAQLDILRINAQSGSGDYTFDGGTPDGFALKAGTSANNRVLALLQAKADGAMAVATVKIDDTGAGSEISEPATLTVSVAVKDVEAIEAKFVDSADADLGELHVISRDAPNAAAMMIAKIVAAKGVNDFQYTKETGSSDKLSVNGNGEVMLDANQPLDGQATLTIIVKVADQGDGSTLTEDVLITLRFVLAETVRASAFLLNNNGNNLPDGTAGADLPLTETQTIRVKTANYETGQVAVGITPTGGLGEPYTATETGATGLSAANTAIDTYLLQVAVDAGLNASNAPATLTAAMIINDGNDTGNLTDGATITVSVVYDKVEPIAAAFQTTTGDPIGGVHVVVRDTGASNTPLHVANVRASDGVGDEGGGNSYTYTQSGTGDLLVNQQGQVMVAARVEPKLTDNNLVATVVIDDSGNWAHVSEPLTKTITVRYSSKLVLVADIRDPRANAVPSVIPITGAPAKIYFPKAGTNTGLTLAQLTFRGGKDGSTYSAVASQQSGLTYNDTDKQILMTKCTDTPAALKSIRLVVNDSPDNDGVSDPLTLNITVESGADECIEPINVQGRNIGVGGGAPGSEITEPVKLYALAGTPLAEKMAVATVFIEKGAPDYTSSKSGSGGLDLEGNRANLLTVFLPKDTQPGSGANGNQLAITIAINDDNTKGGFLTDAAEVTITVNYIEVQPHGQFQAQMAAGVSGDLNAGLLTVRRVVASSTPFDILTDIEGAIPNKERVGIEGGFNKLIFSVDKVQMAGGEEPDGEVRRITLKVSDNAETETSEPLQTAARPDKLFTIAVRYLGELEAAAYDSEDTAAEITLAVNRYVEQANADNVIEVATLSVSGGDSPYTYQLTGDLALADNNASVVIPTSAIATDSGTALTARIVINDIPRRTDTAPATVELAANYILIPGHSNLVVTPDGGQPTDLNGETVYPLIVGATSSSPVAALRNVEFKTALDGATLTREDSASDAELLFDATAEEVRVAGDTPLNGQTVSVVLRGSDGDGDSGDTAAVRAQKAARSDRLYTLQVRYLQALSAKAKVTVADGADPATGADYGDNAREIRVATGTTAEQNVAYIEVVGGTEGYQLAIDTTKADADKFELDGRTLQIKAGTQPGALPNGNALTAFVKVNDDESKVGGPETDELNVEVRVNYIALPEVEGIFVHGRDGVTLTLSSVPLTVYSAWNSGADADATVAATVKATVTGRAGDTFTFHKIGDGGKLTVNENSGAVTLLPNSPTQNRLPLGRYDDHVITVEFRALTNAVATRQTLTVRHHMIHPITANNGSLQSRQQCHPSGQRSGTNSVEVVMAAGEEGSEWDSRGCTYLAFSKHVNVYNVEPRLPIARSVKTPGGVQWSVRNGNEDIFGVVGNTLTYTAERTTLSVVISHKNTGPASHITEEYLRTVYIVFPGVPKLEAVLKNTSGAEITKPLTAYVAAAGENVVASLDVSGGTGGYTYTGNAIEGSSLAVDNQGEISVPLAVVPQESPGTTFKYEVTVNDAGTNAGVTPARKVILTLQYIKTSGPLNAAAVLATPPIANNTIFYGAKDVALLAPINVAEIAPSGGIPNPSYNYEIVEDSGNPANLGISGTSGNNIQVRLTTGDTPGAGAAAERFVTVKVTDTGDTANGIDPQEKMVIVRVSFVEVAAHANLRIEDSGTNRLSPNIVVVRPASETGIVEVAELVKVDGEADTALTQTKTGGLTFDAVGFELEIPANQNPPEGQTLSVVLTGSDGNGKDGDSAAVKAQKAARQDRLYTISVRYVPAIEARVEDSDNNAITEVVELTVTTTGGTELVGKIAASGGVTNTYTYTPTPAEAGDTNLAVDADGNINIIAGTTPVAHVGLSITVNIEVDDQSADDSGETSATNVQIRVKYVLLEPLEIEAQNLAGTELNNSNTPTFYRLENDGLDNDMPVAKVVGSKGAQPYTFALVGADGNGVVNGLKVEKDGTDGTIGNIALVSGETAQAGGAADREITVRLTDEATPNAGQADVILTIRFEAVAAHADVTFTPQSDITKNSAEEYVVVQAGTPGANVHVLDLVSDDTLSKTGDADLLFVADSPNDRLEITSSAPRNRQTLVAEITQTDNDDNDLERARPDRTYTVSVRYIPALAAEAMNADGNAALVLTNGTLVIEKESAASLNIASIAVSGGTSDEYDYSIENKHSGNTLGVTDDGVVYIPADVIPLLNGLELTVAITANDKTSSKDSGATDAAVASITVKYIALPPVAGSFVNTAGVKVEAVLEVYGKAGGGTLTIAATAKAEVSGNSGENYTFAEVGEGPLEIDESTGVISIPDSVTPTGQNLIITVRFVGEVGRSVPTTEILTVNYKPVSPISSTADGFQSVAACHPGDQIKSSADGSLITVIMETMEADDVWNADSNCQYQASGAIALAGGSGNIGGAVQGNADGLALTTVGNEHRVSVVGGTRTYTASSLTLSIVIAYNDEGAGAHITEEYLRTVYVVFPGVPKIVAEMRDLSNNALTDPVTLLVAAAGVNNVAKVTASGGAGDDYTYSGEAINGSNALDVDGNGLISTPQSLTPLDRPGVTVTFAVTVNDQGGDNQAGLTATGPQTVSLTLVYIKSAGTLVAEAVIANPAFADAAATTFYSEAGKTLTAPIDVARIAPTGGLPPYNYAVVGGQNADLGISRASGTDVQVQLKVDDTPSAADRVVTLEVSDSADLATPPADVSTLSLTLTVKFVGVAAHNDLAITRESGIAVNSNGEYVAVRAGAQNEAVNLLSGISTNGTLSRPEGDAGGDAELVWTYASNSGRLAISVGTKPEGKTLSVVLSASDGEATPQKAARQDRLYTISVRYVPAIEAGVRSTTDAALGDADVVELTVLQGVHLVGSISVSGGVGGAYSYTATPATLGGTTLHVDSEGNIRIPTTLAPVAGDGLSITVNIAVDDDKESTDTDRDATSPANVQIRVKYVELEDLALTAKNLQGADVGATDSVGTFYLLEGKTLTAAVLVATVTASGGIKDYIYAVEGGGGDLTFDLSTREVHIAKDKAAQTPGTAGATLSVKVKATDKRGETATLTLRAVFETVPAHPLVEFQPAANSSGKYVVVRAGAQLTAVNVARFEIPPEDALTKTEGDDALVLAAGQVQITANHRPTGKTLTAIITQTDGNDDAREIARPDRLYTISVRYVPAIEARVEDASNAEIAAVVELTVKKGAHFVGSVSVSGGVGGDYSYTPTGVGTSQNLEVDDDGNIRIPTTLEPVAGVGLSITVNIRVDDDENSADSDRDATLPVDVKITVKYVLLESPEIEAQTPAGVRLDSTNTPTFYRLAGATSTADITAAKVVGRKGKSPYTFAIVDADAQGVANGLAVESNGNIVLKSGATPAAGANANRVVTVRLSDSQRPTAETAEVELTVRFEQVETHADVVFTPQSGVTQNDAKEYRVVQAGAPGANVHVLDLASGGDTLSKTEGDADLVLVAGSPNRLEIASSAPRNRQTLTAEITQTDSDDTTPQAIERPDRTYTVSVRYIPAIEARVEDASNAEIAAVVELTAKQGAHLVGSVSVSGGVGGDYSYVPTGVDTSQNLEVDADGNIRIPATLAPVAGDGLSITVNIAVDDDKDSAASDRDATSPANVRITVKYVELESPEIEARDKDGTAALTAPTGSNAAVFYQLSGVALPADLAVAKVVGSKGKLPYAFAIVDENGQVQANAKGLEVNSGTGDITLVSGESTTQTGTAADRVITVRLSDNQRPTAETADATLTIRFEAVAPHPDLTGETGGAHVQSFDLSDNLLTVLVNPGVTEKQVVVRNVAVTAIAPAAAPTLTTITGNLDFDASAKEISIPDGTVPTGDNLSVVLSASDGTDPPQAAARPDKTYSLTVRYLSHVGLSFVGEVGNSLDVTTSGINVRRTAGTTPASVFVASLSASGGAGSYNYSISGHTETGKAINFDTNSNILWIPSSFVPSTSGVRVDIVVTANDNEAITDEARQEIQITYTEAPGDPLPGNFVATAPSSNSRIVGAFDDSKRVTVYGVEADGTSDDLPVMTLSHSNGAVAVSKETGELNYASGQVVIPKAMRKTFGTEFTGVFLATDRRAATADARYSLTVLLAQQLSGTAEGEELFADAKRLPPPDGNKTAANQSRGQFFHTTTESTLFRPVLSFPNITVAGLVARSADNNFQWDFDTKQMRRNGAPETNPSANELVTLIDPAANPKILPAPLTLDVRNREVPALAFVTAAITANEIPHDETPTTRIWKFRVEGGALTRKIYRPFHNLTLSPTGAFTVAASVPPRVDDTDGESEFADFDVHVDFTHADAALRRGQTLTVTVTAEDIGYPGLGAVSHVAEVVLEAEPIPHLQAGVWTPVASGATQITQPVTVTAKLSTSHNVASVSVSRGRPANNQRYTYTGQRINGTGDALTLSEHGVITIPPSTAPLPTPGLTVTLMVTADDTGHPETDPAEVRVTVVYVLQEVLQAGVRKLDGSSLSGTPIIYRLADEPAPVDGLNVVQVVARGGRAPYRYFVHGDSNPGNLIVKDNGIVAIAADETPDVSGTRLVTVRVEDNQDGDLKETAFATITVNFRAVARHSDLQISMASGIVTNSAGQYIAVRAGAQNEEVALLSVQVDNADSLSKSGDNQLLFNKHANTDVYRLRIAPGTEPTGQTLEATLAATDGESDGEKATRPDRDYPLTVRYLANLKAVLLDAGGNPIPDLDNIDIQRKTSGASIFVGSLSVTGGTGGYQFSTLSFTGMGVDENGNVFVAADAEAPTSDPGRQLVINVGINDSGDDSTHTPQINILVQVDYILQSDTPLAGDFEVMRVSGADDRICANAGCTAATPPERLDTSKRLTMYGRHSDSDDDAYVAFSVQFANNADNPELKEGLDSDLKLGTRASDNSYPVMLPADKRKAWGEVMELRLIATDGNTDTRDRAHTVTVLLSEMLLDSAVTVFNGRTSGSGSNSVPQYFYADGQTNLTLFQPLGTMPGLTVEGLEASVAAGAAYDYEWDFDSKQIRRSGAPKPRPNPAAGETPYLDGIHVEATLIDPIDNPKIIQQPLSINIRYRNLAPMTFLTPRRGIVDVAGSATGSDFPLFTGQRVQGGSLLRKNFRPFSNYEIEVTPSLFKVINSIRRQRVTDNEEYLVFDIGIDLTDSAVAAMRDGTMRNVTVRVRDTGYPHVGVAEHTYQVRLGQP